MRLLYICAFSFSMLLASPKAGGCLAVDADRILVGDLASVSPAFSALAPDLEAGFAPSPGARRILSGAELVRLAQRYGANVTSLPDICVERSAELLTIERLRPALEKALDGTGAHLEILDFTQFRLPRGELEFDCTALRPPPAAHPETPVLWRGKLVYDGHHSLLIWARVRVTAEGAWVEATQTLPAGEPIRPEQLTIRSGPRFPFGQLPFEETGAVIGKSPRRSIPAGQPILPAMLTTPPDVERGATVSVVVSSGQAHLEFEAKAESSGHVGETIAVRNPDNGKRFMARVQSKGKAVVETKEEDEHGKIPSEAVRAASRIVDDAGRSGR